MSAKGPSQRAIVLAIALAAALGAGIGLLHHAHAIDPHAAGGHSAQKGIYATGTNPAGKHYAPGLNAQLEKDVAQLFIVGAPSTGPTQALFEELHAADWGGVLLTRANYAGSSELASLTSAIAADATADGNTIPLVLARQAGGDSSAFPPLAPPSEPSLGGSGNIGLVTHDAVLAGRALRQVGVNVVLAPNADIAGVTGAGAGRSYGSEPSLVSQMVVGAVRGFRAGDVIAAVGAFPGEGAASQDPTQGVATVGLTLPDLELRDMVPFAAVASLAAAIQMSDALFDAFDGVTPATLLPAAVALLRGRSHFGGVVISANLEDATLATGQGIGAAAVAAVNAGCDMLLIPGPPADAQIAYEAVLSAISHGAIDPQTLTLSLGRVRAMRRAYGL